MAVNAYLFVDGIDGPSTSMPNCIDVLSVNWGVTQTSTYGRGASGKEAKAGRADFLTLNVTKVLDKTSPLLADHCASGDILKKVYVLYEKPVGDKQAPFYRIYITDALITSVQVAGGGTENPTETVSFAYQQIEWGYKPEKDDGTLDAAIRKGYDLGQLNADFAAPDGF
jgi:type VI secretion system secreted protein Hcp